MAKDRKNARDLGAESPASGSAKEQSIAGSTGGPREAQSRGITKQPAQTSGRRPEGHEQEPEARKSFSSDPEHDPARQGRGSPKPDTLAHSSSQQGIAPRSGSHVGEESVEEEALRGEPEGTHTGHTGSGRQQTPGDRERE